MIDNPLFRGFDDEEIREALSELPNKEKSFKKDTFIHSEGDLVKTVGLVLSGSVIMERSDYLGHKNILGIAGQGNIFAESYAVRQLPLMIDVVANENCRVLFIDLSVLDRLSHNRPWHSRLLRNLLLITSSKNIELSKRNFYTFSKNARGRIMSYLSDLAKKGGNSFDIPLNRQQMADYLNLDRSALSKELCKMRDDGIIEFNKNHFILVNGF